MHLEAFIDYIPCNMKDREIEEIVSLDMPSEIQNEILKQSKKQKLNSSINCCRCKAYISNHRLASLKSVEEIRGDKFKEY